jgi:hypothetical protein
MEYGPGGICGWQVWVSSIIQAQVQKLPCMLNNDSWS